MNKASNYVQTTKEQSAVRKFVADHGCPVNRKDIEHLTIAGRSVAVAKDLTEAERELVAEAIRDTKPVTKACFGNSLELCEYDERFKYTEGFASLDEFDVSGFEHAWCMLDSEKLVDVTTTFDDYYGVVLADHTIRRYTDEENRYYGVIGNHRNRFEFLCEQGYMEA
ncbi:hypothetical protein OB919_02915 [Halobacteria archaeon AArc-curdl1]|uniref:Uncharacterized protein n=1 Tax=Natronosalvus hydrolyticus TaxID=2979988 RepID=A0AAP3E5Q0_9EURY|nr:hypothetical protein [Halobacteria archaeon AArc-curdl1]